MASCGQQMVLLTQGCQLAVPRWCLGSQVFPLRRVPQPPAPPPPTQDPSFWGQAEDRWP